MKKIKILMILLSFLVISTGCSFTQDELERATIYTTVYPVSYLVKQLYGNNSNIASIYPADCDINTYKLSKKQIKTYAKGDIFIYNGLTNEKEIAKDLINENEDLYIMDVANGLKLNNDITELWLSPNNYLMLAKNIKEGLKEKVSNKITIDNIESKYAEFEEKISLMDASLHSLGKTAKENNNNAIIAGNKTFTFLDSYSFEVTVLQDLKDTKIETIKANFKSGKYKYILVLDTDEDNDLIKDLVDNYKAEKIVINSLTMSSDDYFNEMNSFIENLKKVTNN